MSKKTLAVVAVVALLGAACLLLAWPARQPSFDGKSLQEWLLIYATANRDDPTSAATASAAASLRSIGDRAIPLLLKWIPYHRKDWHIKVEILFDKAPVWAANVPFNPRHAELRAILAERAFLAFGQQASNAVPRLIQLLTDTNAPDTAMRSATALSHIGEPALLPLLTVITSPQSPNRALAVYAVSNMTQIGRRADEALPLLLKCLDDGQPEVAENAALALGMLDLDATAVVPALTKCLTSPHIALRTRAAYSLSRYGTRASSSLPALQNCVVDPDPQVRSAASAAMTNIAPEVLTNALTQ